MGAVGHYFVDTLARVPLIAILRGSRPERAVEIAETCWGEGIELVEVALSEPDSLTALEAVCARAEELGHVAGAGSVIEPRSLTAALEAGASFAVSPGFDVDTVHEARSAEVPLLPGVTTPSEVQEALRADVTVLKLFPAALLGPGWLGALSGPFPDVGFVAVGGVSADNAGHFIQAGALGVGVGSALERDGVGALVRTVTDPSTSETSDI